MAQSPVSGFGEKLRRQREMRGISLEEISAFTKIGTRSLRAIEEEDFEKLPGGIFNKGFVRAYSRFLGLDEEETVADFDAAWDEYEADKRPALEPPSANDRQPAGSRSVWLFILALLLLTALAGLSLFQRRKHQEAISAVAPPSERSQSGSNSASNSIPPLPTRQQPTPTQDAADHIASAKTEVQKAPASNPSGAVAAAEQDKSITQTSSPAPIRLQVFAREDSWLAVSVDGQEIGEGILSAQKTRSIHGQKEVRLRVGNLAGVQVSFNGEPVDVDGQPKEVKELIFTAQGLQR